MSVRKIGVAAATMVAALTFLSGQALAAANGNSQGDPRLNGLWNVDAQYRARTGATARVELTPAGQAIASENAARAQERLARGEPVGLGSYICGTNGVPFVTGTSEPWLLTVTDEEVTQVFERRQLLPRRFYMGRTWPDLSKMPPLKNGYSLAHWEGKELRIETRGMPSGAAGQGGVIRGPKTVLTERVRLSDDGQQLFWTYTWSDPDLLAKPLDFTLKYDRAPPHTFSYTHPCDPNEGSARTVSELPQD